MTTTARSPAAAPRTTATTSPIVWHDYLTSDTEGAIAFYTKLIGWTITPYQDAKGNYNMFTNRGTTVGGVMELTADQKKAGVPPHWMMYVGVADADKSHKLATSLGAKSVVAPRDIPNIGRFAILSDPQGATFAIFQPTDGGKGPSGSSSATGNFSWHELIATDYQKAAEFYGKLFGWEKRDAHDMGHMGTYQLFGLPGAKEPLGGMFNAQKGMPVSWTCYISVPDVDRSAADIKRLGGTVANGPMEVPGGDKIVVGKDPKGGLFALHWVKPK